MQVLSHLINKSDNENLSHSVSDTIGIRIFLNWKQKVNCDNDDNEGDIFAAQGPP